MNASNLSVQLNAGDLPLQLTSFIGREHDLAEVQRMLAGARQVTLTGAGGSGKTRLALQAAHALRGAYADGAWLVDLTPLREPELIAQAAVQALGLHLAAGEPPLQALLEILRPRRMLLVLDNCEHLIDACAQFAQQALTSTPGLNILATSREPLAVPGERVYPVPGLPFPRQTNGAARPGQAEIQALLAYDSVRLFGERARASSHAFSITAENVPAVAEICRRLDGLPLAIELAFFFMMSPAFRAFGEQDNGALIAYLKTLPPVDNELPERRFEPMARVMMAVGAFPPPAADQIDHAAQLPESVQPGATAAYGDVLARACTECHGSNLNGMPFGPPGEEVLTPNLTPGGGMASWSEEDFINTLRKGVTPDGRPLNEEMPWKYYGQMSEAEIKALWLYLQSLPALEQGK